MPDVSWLGLDWGTTNLRAFAINSAGKIVDERHSSKGMGSLNSDEFEPALLELIEPWLSETDGKLPVFACGMVGAKQGWREANYRQIPCEPVTADGLTIVPTQSEQIIVHILPGLCQRDPSDVMRGEETQIAGHLLNHSHFNGAVCLPGTHSKWVALSSGKVSEFTTYMTGEMFDVMSSQSVLKHSVVSEGWDDEAFDDAVREAIINPTKIAEALFRLRADALLENVANETCRARFSGLLIGQELSLAKRYWLDTPVALIGSNATVPLYDQALRTLGVTPEIVDTRAATLAGLKLVAQQAQKAA